jgi:ferredoxin
MKTNKALFKYNGGRGALLCSMCRVILKTGDQFTEEEIEAIKGHAIMEPQYCLKCQLIQALNEIDKEWKESVTVRDDVKYRVIRFAPPFPDKVLDIITQPDVTCYGFLTTQFEQGIDVYFKM